MVSKRCRLLFAWSDPPDVLPHLLEAIQSFSMVFYNNIDAYHISLSMGCVKVGLEPGGAGNSNFSHTALGHGLIHHNLGALVPFSNPFPWFLSMCFHDTYYLARGHIRSGRIPYMRPALLKHLTAMLHEVNAYMKS